MKDIAEDKRRQRVTEAEVELMRAKAEALRRKQPKKAADAGTANTDAEKFRLAIMRVTARLPDFPQFAAEIVRIDQALADDDLSYEDYVEGLYLMAKFGSFSKSPVAARAVAPSLAKPKDAAAAQP
jgi:hypothetical protein